MRIHRWIPRSALLIGVASLMLLMDCVVLADHPFFAPDQCRVDESLLGRWEDRAGRPEGDVQGHYEVTPSPDGHSMDTLGGYENSREKAGRFWVTEVHGQQLMCFSFEEQKPVKYMLFRVQKHKEAIELDSLNLAWLQKQLDSGQLTFDVEKSGGSSPMLIKAETAQMQPLIRMAAKDPEAFNDKAPIFLTREKTVH